VVIKNAYHDHKLQKYSDSIFFKDAVYNFVFNNNKTIIKDSPSIYISETCGSAIAGQVWCNAQYIDIELSAWILVDTKQTQGVIRHELAHAIVFMCKLKGSQHGRGFTQALKLTSPRLFRRDRHWRDTSAVYMERKKYHPKTQLLVS
tara:strand:+ start:13759 stop:14199 length:441 start_codon:yes stop_codon:yes gene_type:complete